MLDGELASSTTALAVAGVAAIIFLLGAAGLLIPDRRSPITLSFFLLTSTAAVWLGGLSRLIPAGSEQMALFWARVTYVGVCLIPAAVLQFSAALADALSRRRNVLLAAWATSAMFVGLFTLTDGFLTGVHHYAWGYYARLGPASILFLAFFTFALLNSLATLRAALFTEVTEQHKRRIRSFLGALAVGYLGSIDFVPSFGVDIEPVGFVAVLGFIVLSVRAIWRYRFVDLSPSFVADQLLETVPGGVLAVDTRGRIHVANPAAADLLGRTVDDLIGKDLRTLLHSQALPISESQTLVRAGRTRNRIVTWPRLDGSTVELSVTATMLRDADGLPVGILYVLRDLSEQRRAEQHEFAANHDGLTGIPNRVYAANRFDSLASDVTARGRIGALMFLDLDGFKAVNDRYGHGVGDKVLQVIATRLRNALRDDDVAARQGGDEFIVMVSLRSRSDVEIVAAKLTSVVRQTVTIDSIDVRLGVSIGTALCPDDGEEFDDLVRTADARMYAAKRARAPQPPRQTDRVAPSPLASESRA